MKRTALELSQRFRDVVASQDADAIASYLEDINDSVGEIDMSQYVSKADYDAVVADRDANIVKVQEYRDKYINRFYQPANSADDTTLIYGATNQEALEKDEYDVSYKDLFE